MGIDAGFDMVPPLSKGTVDQRNWEAFLDIIKTCYDDDPQVEIMPNYIEFKAGEHPTLPFECHKFLRFSSKISGSGAGGVEGYIRTTLRAAQMKFGDRVQPWHEARDQYGHYDWREVNDSWRSYSQPDPPSTPTTIAQSVLSADPIPELELPLFEIQQIQGKGRALVARVNIAKGKRILCEKPFFTTSSLSSREAIESDIVVKLKALPREQQREFLSLHNHFPGRRPFSGIVKTNALPCGPGSPVGGVYPTICLINHSCLPNAHNNWNSDSQTETIHALREIQSGEEITISYDNAGPRKSRRDKLQECFGFDCTCAICSLGEAEQSQSDARRVQIATLDNAIGDPMRVLMKPGESLADCQKLLHLLEEEYDLGAEALKARLYYDAFQICITHSDEARASILAEKAYKARVFCEGEDSPQTKKMKNFKDCPAAHPSAGLSTMWQTSMGSVPRGLSLEDIENWLWTRTG